MCVRAVRACVRATDHAGGVVRGDGARHAAAAHDQRPGGLLMLVGVAVDNAKVLLYPDQRGLDEACVPPTMRWRVREGGPERRQRCDGGRFIAVESKEAERSLMLCLLFSFS